ncbi:hypothetical protein M3J09_004931 [Ascochyta lentis]
MMTTRSAAIHATPSLHLLILKFNVKHRYPFWRIIDVKTSKHSVSSS